jgi:hypothetical protein
MWEWGRAEERDALLFPGVEMLNPKISGGGARYFPLWESQVGPGGNCRACWAARFRNQETKNNLAAPEHTTFFLLCARSLKKN